MSVRVERRGIIGCAAEVGMEQCWATRANAIQSDRLRRIIHQAGVAFVRNHEASGLTFRDTEDIHVYGPFPDTEYLEPMLDPEMMLMPKEQHAQIVRERASEMVFSNYLLVGAFEKKGAEQHV